MNAHLTALQIKGGAHASETVKQLTQTVRGCVPVVGVRKQYLKQLGPTNRPIFFRGEIEEQKEQQWRLGRDLDVRDADCAVAENRESDCVHVPQLRKSL
jgi:hypothetical protein